MVPGDEIPSTLDAPDVRVPDRPSVRRLQPPPDVPDRYEVLEVVGEGGMGVVYRAYDRRARRDVALKTLRAFDPAALLRLKKEFRAVCALPHPNLVQLFELHLVERSAFFTMELVVGAPLHTWLIQNADPQALTDEASARTARVMSQLAQALAFVHAHGRLHRDLKPSNVLVRPDDIVVLLDFGLTLDLRSDASVQGALGTVAGTPGYMAPEQAWGGAVGPAADWFSFGAILHEWLAGHLPGEEGRRPSVLSRAARRWIALAQGLVAREPEARPSASEVLDSLASLGGPALQGPSPATPTRFVGRRTELARLRRAAKVRGHARVVSLLGTSGIGKSALLAAFLREDSTALVVGGRCHPREHVPFRALDPLVDQLARHLSLEPLESVPEDAPALARQFPVLGPALRVPPLDADVQDSSLQHRAAQAFRDVLDRVARRRPLIAWIDDTQWGDPDSWRLLRTVMREPDPPPLLLVLSGRPTPEAAPLADLGGREQIELGALSDGDAAELVETRGQPATAGLLGAAKGVPLLLTLLERDTESLADAIHARVERLESEATEVLQLLAVAGAPLGGMLLDEAVGGETHGARAELLEAGLVRRVGDGDHFLPAHDSIGEHVANRLDDGAQRAVHGRLADAVLARGADPQRLVMHLVAAGRRSDVRRYALAAADRAERQLAFDEVTRLLAIAVDHLDGRADPDLRVRFARSLARVGRHRAASVAWREAAAEAPDAGRQDCELRAGVQLLYSGRVAEGHALIRDALGDERRWMPRTRVGAFARIILWEVRLAMRRWRSEIVEAPDAERLRLVDLVGAATTSLGFVDPIRATALNGRFSWLALESGDRRRMGFAIGQRAASVAALGGRAAAVEELIRRARWIIEPLPPAARQSANDTNEFGTAFHSGRWAEALRWCDAAERRLRTGVELMPNAYAHLRQIRLWSLTYLGRYRALGEAAHSELARATATDDLIALTGLHCGFLLSHRLAHGRVEEARRDLDTVMERWTAPSIFDALAVAARARIAMAEGDGVGAYRGLREGWPTVRRSGVLKLTSTAVDFFSVRGRAALLVGLRSGSRAHIHEAARLARRARAVRAAHADARGLQLLAGVAAARGDTSLAAQTLFDAEQAALEAEAVAQAYACRRARLTLQGSDEKLLEVDAALVDLGIAEPAWFTRQEVPGV